MYKLFQKVNLRSLFCLGDLDFPDFPSLFCLDRDKHDERIMVFIIEDTPVEFFFSQSKST